MKQLPALSELERLLEYDPNTGSLTWKVSTGRVMAGTVAGSAHNRGYWRVRVNGTQYLAHRICWFLYYKEEPPLTVDHINRVKTDNRIANLRSISYSEQNFNTKLSSRNKTGQRGVYLVESTGKWKARLTLNKEIIHLGHFDTFEQAVAARLKAENEFTHLTKNK